MDTSLRGGPEDWLPNSHADWARVHKFDKFMKNNWVCPPKLRLSTLFNSGLDTFGHIGIHFDGFRDQMACKSFQCFNESFLEIFITLLCYHLELFVQLFHEIMLLPLLCNFERWQFWPLKCIIYAA